MDAYYTYSKTMQYGAADSNFQKDGLTQDFSNIAGSVGLSPEKSTSLHTRPLLRITDSRIRESVYPVACAGGWTYKGSWTYAADSH